MILDDAGGVRADAAGVGGSGDPVNHGCVEAEAVVVDDDLASAVDPDADVQGGARGCGSGQRFGVANGLRSRDAEGNPLLLATVGDA